MWKGIAYGALTEAIAFVILYVILHMIGAI